MQHEGRPFPGSSDSKRHCRKFFASAEQRLIFPTTRYHRTMRPKPAPDYLSGYPPALRAQIEQLIAQQKLGPLLRQKYPQRHAVTTDKALYDFALAIKEDCLRHAGQLSKVLYDSKLQLLKDALGTHTTVARVQGTQLKTKREIRVAAVFRNLPEAFLRMIVVHELAHMKEREHDKAFYQLCVYMEPDYHQIEFDLRASLTLFERSGLSPFG
jgi:predicted metal-dependent hydrolase